VVGERLRAVLQRGLLVGDCVGADARSGSAEHPVCGDQVQLSLRLVDGRIGELRWRAAGCPASMAVAALAAQELTGVAPGAAAGALRAAIAAHGGLAAHERHAEAMVLRALAQACGVG
jgi:NifU-like protein involved in Fe-S cluster formation